jgi:hypothetical protein
MERKRNDDDMVVVAAITCTMIIIVMTTMTIMNVVVQMIIMRTIYGRIKAVLLNRIERIAMDNAINKRDMDEKAII